MKTINYKLNKKGSHVAVIISFVIFVTFLFFIYAALEPAVKSKQAGEQFLSSSKDALLTNFSANITYAAIHINNDFDVDGEDCLRITSLSQIMPSGLDGDNIFIKDSSESTVGFSWDGQDSSLEVEEENSNRLFRAYVSEAISSSETSLNGCPAVSSNSYTLGLVKTEEKAFEQKIVNAIQVYQTNYPAFKASIGISEDKNIGFDFAYSNGTSVTTGEESPETNVYALEFSFDYLSRNMITEAGKLTVRTW